MHLAGKQLIDISPKNLFQGMKTFKSITFSLCLFCPFLDEFIILSYPLSTLPYMRPCWQGSRWEGGSSRQRLMSDKWCNNHTRTVPSRWDEVLIELSFSIISHGVESMWHPPPQKSHSGCWCLTMVIWQSEGVAPIALDLPAPGYKEVQCRPDGCWWGGG